MIAGLQGEVKRIEGGVVEVRVGPMTYELRLMQEAGREPPELQPGDERHFYTHTSVSEAGVALYGFLLPEERAAFRRLLKVSRVGPGLAQKILAGIAPAELERAIAAGDASRLEQVKGVGEKLARLIIVQLGERPPKKGRRHGKEA